MIIKIKKTYGSNFDLVTAVKDGADKSYTLLVDDKGQRWIKLNSAQIQAV